MYLHYLKKSTEGWSIYSVLFDLSGGILSFLQMTIDAFNNGEIMHLETQQWFTIVLEDF